MKRPTILPSTGFFLLLVLAGGIAGNGSHAGTLRTDLYNEGSRLLDEGKNKEAASFFEKVLAGHPGRIEAFDAIFEARSRECGFDRAAAFLRPLSISPGTDSTRLALFVQAYRKKHERIFETAAADFRDAAEYSLGGGDTLSAAICLMRTALSLLGARDAPGAVREIERMRTLAPSIRGYRRLPLELDAMLGEACNLMDRIPEADSLYRHALERAGKQGFRQIAAYCLNGLGRLNEKRQLTDEAAGYYARALAEMRTLGSVEQTAALLNNLGQAETRMGNHGDADAHLGEAKDLALSCGSTWQLGYIYYGLGAVAEARFDTEEALGLFRTSLEHHTGQGNTWGELGARLRLAYNHVNLGEFSNAIDHYTRCLEVYEEMGSLYGLSWTLGGLALANHRLGNFKQAQEYYTRALDVRTGLGDRRGAAWCLNSLGMVSDVQCNYRRALAYEHEAMEIYEELGDSTGIGSVHFSIGSVYFYLGNYGKSMEHFERAYGIASGRGDIYLLGKVASGMASVYSAAGRLDLAERFYLENLETSRRIGNITGIAWALNNTASFYIESNDRSRAMDYLDEALSILPERGIDHVRARTLLLLGRTAGSAGEAIRYTEEALSLARMNGLKELAWKCLSDLGEYNRTNRNMYESKLLQERAILEIESLHRGVGSDELRRHMLRPALEPFERIISLIVDTSRDTDAVREAFGYTERSKARILASLLREALSRIGREYGGSFAWRKDLVSQLSHIQSRLQDGSLGNDERQRLRKGMARIERELTRQEILHSEERRDYSAAVYPSHEEIADLPATLKPSERLISYYLGDKRSYLFTARGNTIEVFCLPERAAIEHKAGVFLRMLRQFAGGQGGVSGKNGASLPREVLDRASEELYDLLIGPAGDRLQPGETLVIVPDGLLNRLPFTLLRNGGTCLIERHEIFYAPSLRSLYYLRKRADARSRAGERERIDVIAMGSSGGSGAGQHGTRRVYPFTDIPIEPLPRAASEARAVAGMFGRSMHMTGTRASESSFKGHPLDMARILHIAAHSYIDNEDVRRSFIVLSPETESARERSVPREDGLLQWHEIVGLELSANLVTLSACRAAGGVLTYGEGITGLTQAFLYAGGDCVLASFVDVPDSFAGRFMIAFYRHLKSGKTASAALRAAQLDAMSWSDIAHGPSLWGSFSLIGDGNITIPFSE